MPRFLTPIIAKEEIIVHDEFIIGNQNIFGVTSGRDSYWTNVNVISSLSSQNGIYTSISSTYINANTIALLKQPIFAKAFLSITQVPMENTGFYLNDNNNTSYYYEYDYDNVSSADYPIQITISDEVSSVCIKTVSAINDSGLFTSLYDSLCNKIWVYQKVAGTSGNRSVTNNNSLSTYSNFIGGEDNKLIFGDGTTQYTAYTGIPHDVAYLRNLSSYLPLTGGVLTNTLCGTNAYFNNFIYSPSITGVKFYGDGSNLTGIIASGGYSTDTTKLPLSGGTLTGGITGTTAIFDSISAISISGIHYGDGSNLTNINGLASVINTVSSLSSDWINSVNVLSSLSSNWNGSVNTLSSLSSIWSNSVNTVSSLSSDWINSVNVLSSLSSIWSNSVNIVSSLSSDWNNSVNTLSSLSSYWTNVFNTVSSLSSDWINSTNTLSSLSSIWGNSVNSLSSLSGIWSNTTNTVSSLSNIWTNSVNTISSLSSDWNNSVNTLSSLSSIWINASNTLSSLSTTWSNSTNTVSGLSSIWSNSVNTVSSLSSNWNNVVNTVSSISSNFVYLYHLSSYLPLSGGALYGDLTIFGGITALSGAVFVNTIFQDTSALRIYNSGLGPALYVEQASGSGDVAVFYDADGIEVLHVGNALNPTSSGVIGIKTSTPNKTLTIVGDVSATDGIWASKFYGDGSSLTNIKGLDSVISTVSSLSSNWNGSVNTLSSLSSIWSNSVNIVSSLSSDWNNSVNTVSSLSSDWINSVNLLSSLSSDWNGSVNTLSSLSSIWTNSVNTLSSLSSIWNNSVNTLSSLSSIWSDSVNTLSSLSSDWYNTTYIVSSLSGIWINSVNTLSSLSSDWNNSYNTVSSLSSDWILSVNTLSSLSSIWSNSVNTVSSLSSTWTNSVNLLSNISANFAYVYHLSSYLPLSGGTLTGGITGTTAYFSNEVYGSTATPPTSSNQLATTAFVWDNLVTGLASGSAIASTVIATVTNADTVQLTRGTVVYSFGSQGDRVSVKMASASAEATSSKALGFVNQTIPVGGIGTVTLYGAMDKLDLGSPFVAGDALWLGTTPGTYTRVKPQAPIHSVYLGVVQRANSGNGTAYIKIQNGYELNEIHDVQITNPLSGQIIRLDSTAKLWTNQTPLFTDSEISSSSVWNNTTSTVSSNSAKWESVYSNINSTSSNWSNTYGIVSGLSSKWDSVYSSVNSISSDWNNTTSTVSSNSAKWESVYTTVINNSSTYVTLTATQVVKNKTIIDWMTLVRGYNTVPTLLSTIVTGDVYTYTYNSSPSNITYYRYIATDGSEDSFYSYFSGSTLSGLIATKSITI